jgi:hypothetical protein
MLHDISHRIVLLVMCIDVMTLILEVIIIFLPLIAIEDEAELHLHVNFLLRGLGVMPFGFWVLPRFTLSPITTITLL